MATKQDWMEKLATCSSNELRVAYLFTSYLRHVKTHGGDGQVIATVGSDRIEAFECRFIHRQLKD